MKTPAPNTLTIRSLLFGTIVSAVFAGVTSYLDQQHMYLTATQVAVLPYVLLFATVLAINPLCRLIRLIRPFTTAEVMAVFIMGSVSAGIGTFGLSAQLMPISGSLFNRHWNNAQSRWDETVTPLLNESYFLAEPGLQDAAEAYRFSLAELTEVQRRHRAAEAVVEAEQALSELQAGDAPAAERPQQLRFARRALEAARRAWRSHEADVTVDETVASHPAKIDRLAQAHAAKEQRLRELEEAAFIKVDTFRRGLGPGKRAMPGLIKSSNESIGEYLQRWRRLRVGLASLSKLRDVQRRIEAGQTIDDSVVAGLHAAADQLRPIGDTATLSQQKRKLLAEEASLTGQKSQNTRERFELSRAKPFVTIGEAERIAEKIKELDRAQTELDKQLLAVKAQVNALDVQLLIKVAAQQTGSEIEQLAAAAESQSMSADDVSVAITQIAGRYATFDASLRRFLVGEVPWSQWGGVLLRWAMVIGLTYLVLMTFNVLIFRQWAHQEKLIYPLAQLPMMLAGAGGADEQAEGEAAGERASPAQPAGAIPAMFRDGGFWAGFGIAGFVLAWNMFVRWQLVPGLAQIPMNWNWGGFIAGTPLAGIGSWAGRHSVFFTMVGLAFLVPTRISFSLWSFHLAFFGLLLALVWLGYGVDYSSFPGDWYYTSNFRYAMGGGAMMMFAAAILIRCRHYLFCGLWMPGDRAKRVLASLDRDEQIELRICSLLFLAGSVMLIVVLWRSMGAGLVPTLIFYFVMLVITIGLIRAVAEGGLLGFQCWFGPFHLIRAFVGLGKGWAAAPMLAPLMMFHAIMFLDIKTFIAPTMANMIKIRDDLRIGRLRFHISVLLSIAAAFVIATVTHLIMTYAPGRGADGMNSWFYTLLPQGAFDRLSAVSKTPPAASWPSASWMIAGVVAMAALLWGRRKLFWLPHPIGLIMWVNPMMISYWFSILLGWAAKSAVTKYGHQQTYLRARNVAVGLIVGELTMIVIDAVANLLGAPGEPLNLNRF